MLFLLVLPFLTLTLQNAGIDLRGTVFYFYFIFLLLLLLWYYVFINLSSDQVSCFHFDRYFVLTASDLEEWYQNPESFHHEQDMVLWTEKLRPCAEALYIVLFENHSQVCKICFYFSRIIIYFNCLYFYSIHLFLSEVCGYMILMFHIAARPCCGFYPSRGNEWLL